MVSYAILLFCVAVAVAAPQMKSVKNKTKSRIIPGAYIVEFKADFTSRSNINHVKLKNNLRIFNLTIFL